MNKRQEVASGTTSKAKRPSRPVTEKASRAGTGKKGSGGDTREKLLDAAELKFAEHGYDGTSLRDISKAGGVHWPLATYYFKTKEELFSEVVERRAIELTRVRLATLAQIDLSTTAPEESVRLLIQGYISPLLKARYGRSVQWQAHVRLEAAHLVNVKRWAPLVRKHFDEAAQAYLSAFRRVLPQADENALLNAFSFMISTTLYACSKTDRFSKWKRKPASRAEELAEMTEDLIRFIHAGFKDLASPRNTRAPSSLTR